MTYRTTTLTAVFALLASGALAQQATTITVPLGEPAAVQDGAGSTYSTTVNTDGTPAVAPAVGQPPAPTTGATVTAATPTPTPAAPAATPAAAEATPAATPAAATPAAEATPAATSGDAIQANPAAPTPTVADVQAPASQAPAVVEGATTDPAAPAERAATSVDATTAPADAATAASEAAAAPDAGAPAAAAPEAGAAAVPAAGDHAAAPATEGAAPAAAHAAPHQEITDVKFSFEGPFGSFDQHELQRGLQVYTEVCSACHGLRYVPLRTLSDAHGPGMPEDQVRAYAAALTIVDKESGEERPRTPTDAFPRVTGDGMGPDLSLMAKARAGFHGPYGTGINQFFRGIGGPEYIYSILTHYTGETKEEAGKTFYQNTAFPGGWIAMPPPLTADQVTFADGSPSTLEAEAKDIAAFLMWTAEPQMMARKRNGLVAVIFLVFLSSLLYLVNKRLWWPVKHGRAQ